MVLQILSTFISRTIPAHYYVPSIATLVALTITYAFSQGRRTTRDRDLHGRTIILTGAFTSTGLTLLEHLAKKGAHVIVLLPTPTLTSAQDEILTLLRNTTSNEFIYAEPCPLESPKAIKEFCQKFATTENEQTRRIDALILAHEYNHIGILKAGSLGRPEVHDSECMVRDTRSMATFLLVALLLPAMLVAPADRDIRIINVVNPFYAAAVKNFDPNLASKTFREKGASQIQKSTILLEGQRSLRTIVFTRHLQRILDALPSPNHLGVKSKKSNIMAVSVSPGISRTDTVIPFLLHSIGSPDEFMLMRWLGVILYLICLPLLYLLTKNPNSSMQSILHVLCVPRPTVTVGPIMEDVIAPQQQIPNRKNSQKNISIDKDDELLPGALYADCSVVKLDLGEDEVQEQVPDVTKLGLGNEGLGRSIWEALEEAVKIWEKEESSRSKD